VDALVDLELRYGSHRAAATAIRLLSPKPDLALLLEVDAAVAARRKPDDKSLSTLQDMQSAYADAARRMGLFCLDASQSKEDVVEQAHLLVRAAVRTRHERERGPIMSSTEPRP
jgi:thymidylate kinase